MRIKELDAFRGIAAFGVVLFHYTTRYNQIFESNSSMSFSYGWLGVPMFFILSGFVIQLTVDRSKNAPHFLWKRFLRLYPTYWISLLITIIVIQLTGFIQKPHFTFTAYDAIINFTMFQELFGYKNVDGAYWSLLPELLFYLLMAFLLFFDKLKNFYWINFILLIAGILQLIFSNSFWGKLLNLNYILLFMIGICFYRIREYKYNRYEHFFIFFNLITASFLFYQVDSANPVKVLLFCFAVIVILFYLFIYNKINWLGKYKPLIFLGNISYALYLIHQNIGYSVINYFDTRWNNKILGIISAIFISIILAYIITILIEPVLKNRIIQLTTLRTKISNYLK